MDWYYAVERERVGPFNEDAFRELVANGTVSDETLVWNPELPGWRRWRDVRAAQAITAGPPPLIRTDAPPVETCVECGEAIAPSRGVRLRGAFVCARCKPIYVLRLKQGSPLPGPLASGGHGARFAAKTIDSLILMIITYTIGYIVMSLGSAVDDASGTGAALFIVGIGAWSVGSMVLGVAFSSYFVSCFGGTPGKLMLGLRVVDSAGGRPGFATAVGRVFSEFVSQMVCYLGYLMVLFDSQRRALHDHMAGTRVVKYDGND